MDIVEVSMDSAKLSARVCSYFGARAGYGSGMDDIVTDRLRLKPLGVEDLDAYAGIMGEPEVGKWFPKGTSYTREESEKSLSSIMEHWDKYGFGIWAVRTRDSPTLLGRCGLNTVTEIGGRGRLRVLQGILGKRLWNRIREGSPAIWFPEPESKSDHRPCKTRQHCFTKSPREDRHALRRKHPIMGNRLHLLRHLRKRVSQTSQHTLKRANTR